MIQGVFYEESAEMSEKDFLHIREILTKNPIDTRQARSIMADGDWWKIAKKYAQEAQHDPVQRI